MADGQEVVEPGEPSAQGAPQDKWRVLAGKVGDEQNADVILVSAEIDDEIADQLIANVKGRPRRENVFLLLTTRGGSADAAFRMCRCLQKYYTRFVLYIYGMCKSAGTLVAIGADEIVLSDYGEFGPLDVQLGKKDELFENTSGLDLSQALQSLNARILDFFRYALVDMRSGSRGQISTKLAAEIATNMAIGAYGQIYSQVDPAQLGGIERAVRIAVDYGTRLGAARDNLKPQAVERLVSAYPSHSFVIDLVEARTLFNNVRDPSILEEELGECISFVTRDETKQTVVALLNESIGGTDESIEHAQEGAQAERHGSNEDHDAAPEAADAPHQIDGIGETPSAPSAH